MMVLVTYDMETQSDDGKRCLRQIAKLRQNEGQRLQFSVFECLLDPALGGRVPRQSPRDQ